MKKAIIILIASVSLLFLSGCMSMGTTSVTRTATDENIDLSGRWNDTDARLTAEVLIGDVLSRPWLSDYVTEVGDKPVVMVGEIRNKSSEHIDLQPLVKNFQMELINSGKVRFVADVQAREEVRAEKDDQQSNASESTAVRVANSTAAAFMLQGVITTTVDAVDGKRVVLYQTNMELVNMETEEVVWLGGHQIKKFVQQAKASW